MTGFRIVQSNGSEEPLAFVDNELVGKCSAYDDEPNVFEIFFDAPLSPAAAKANLATSDARLRSLRIDQLQFVLLGRAWHVRLSVSDLRSTEVRLFCSPAWGQWISIFTLLELKTAIQEVASEFDATLERDWDQDEFYVILRRAISTWSLGDVLQRSEADLSAMYQRAFEYAAEHNPRAVVSIFNFPPTVAIACEQYLLHFVDFLRDVGVDTMGEVRQEAGKILFTLTPVDQSQGLAAIRDALTMYLSLPSSTLDETAAVTELDRVTVDRLTMNLYHLKSQLAAAGMMVRLQESTIAAQELTIETQQALLAGARHSTDREALIPGIVDVVAVEGKGVRIDLPALVRHLKALFGRRE